MTDSYLTRIPTRSLVHIASAFSPNNYKDNANSRHKMVMSLFPQLEGENPRAKMNILYRVETTPQGSFFLIRSKIPPANIPTVETYKENLSRFQTGDTLRFRIVISPVTRHKKKDIPIYDTSDIEAWVLNKLSSFFSDTEITTINTGTIKRYQKNRNSVPMARIDGIATVSNTEILQDALISGIGRNKNYGAGLVTVVKL